MFYITQQFVMKYPKKIYLNIFIILLQLVIRLTQKDPKLRGHYDMYRERNVLIIYPKYCVATLIFSPKYSHIQFILVDLILLTVNFRYLRILFCMITSNWPTVKDCNLRSRIYIIRIITFISNQHLK